MGCRGASEVYEVLPEKLSRSVTRARGGVNATMVRARGEYKSVVKVVLSDRRERWSERSE